MWKTWPFGTDDRQDPNASNSQIVIILKKEQEEEESRKAIIKPPLLYNEAKNATVLLPMTSPNIALFPKFFHWWNSAVSVNDAIVNYSAPHFKCIAAPACANQLLAGPIFVCPPLDFQVESL